MCLKSFKKGSLSSKKLSFDHCPEKKEEVVGDGTNPAVVFGHNT